MAIARFLENRKSVRDFRDKKANKSTIEQIKNAIEQISAEVERDDIFFDFFEDGKSVYDKLENLGGYNMVMIKSPHYIGLEVLCDKPETILYGSYYMEKLITKINEIGLSTCWITVVHVDDSLMNQHGGKVDYLLALGYPKRKIPFFSDSEDVERRSISEIVFKGEVEEPISSEELESLGLRDIFHYLKYAPSSYNTQPWRFLINNNKVTLLYSHTGEEDIRYADVGVIMYYFEELAKSKGIGSGWEIVEGEIQGEKANYKKIAVFSI